MVKELRDEEPQVSSFDEYLTFLLIRAEVALSQEFYERIGYAGLSETAWRVLATLIEHDGMIVTALAQVTFMKQPTLTKLLDRMVRDEFVERRGSPGDRRKTEIYLTEKGRAVATDLVRLAQRYEVDLLDNKESEALKSLLRRLIDGCLARRNNNQRRRGLRG